MIIRQLISGSSVVVQLKESAQARQIGFPAVSPIRGDILIDPVSSHNSESFVSARKIPPHDWRSFFLVLYLTSVYNIGVRVFTRFYKYNAAGGGWETHLYIFW